VLNELFSQYPVLSRKYWKELPIPNAQMILLKGTSIWNPTDGAPSAPMAIQRPDYHNQVFHIDGEDISILEMLNLPESLRNRFSSFIDILHYLNCWSFGESPGGQDLFNQLKDLGVFGLSKPKSVNLKLKVDSKVGQKYRPKTQIGSSHPVRAALQTLKKSKKIDSFRNNREISKRIIRDIATELKLVEVPTISKVEIYKRFLIGHVVETRQTNFMKYVRQIGTDTFQIVQRLSTGCLKVLINSLPFIHSSIGFQDLKKISDLNFSLRTRDQNFRFLDFKF
jgi:hypothetical protein